MEFNDIDDIIETIGQEPFSIRTQAIRCEILLWELLRWHSGDKFMLQLAESFADCGLLTLPEKTTPHKENMMDGIFIPDMKKPTSCNDCDFNGDNGFCAVRKDFPMDKPGRECPIVEMTLPEKPTLPE